jgi:hypothetical protein
MPTTRLGIYPAAERPNTLQPTFVMRKKKGWLWLSMRLLLSASDPISRQLQGHREDLRWIGLHDQRSHVLWDRRKKSRCSYRTRSLRSRSELSSYSSDGLHPTSHEGFRLCRICWILLGPRPHIVGAAWARFCFETATKVSLLQLLQVEPAESQVALL